ncbi:hypothetical protein BDB01DRAFT_775575 [Pilobolus umbonatus]|nr:hypothetical protein BDB01DRAFT_775575 [Pilobolus umbonatus]
MFIQDSHVYKLESCYNHRITWQITDPLAETMADTRFQPGGIRLKAIPGELELYNDTSLYYNADGVIFNTKHNSEIDIIETTGPFCLLNKSKETQDHIKAGYGLVSMLHYIGRKFPRGDFDIFKNIDVFFIQVTRKYIF